MEFSENIKEKLRLLPDKPGVYKMFDKKGEVIYVGKAKVLKNRVRQYFREHNVQSGYDNKVRTMVSHIADFEYIITSSETEALMLEANLIRRFKPHYNILLKDDKHFPYLRVDLRRDYPTFTIARRLTNDGAKYFGPYLASQSLNEALTAIRDFFPIRNCKKDIAKMIARRERPCLMYHIGKCCAPCSGEVSREEYHDMIDKICRFLEGDTSDVVASLTEKMQRASQAMEYEQAAAYRDRIAAVRRLADKQRAATAKTNRYDVFAVAQENGDSMVFTLFVHEGNIIGTQSFYLPEHDEPQSEILEAFIKQFYTEAPDIPREVIIQSDIEDGDALEEWFHDICGHSVHIFCPQRGDKKALSVMAYTNAAAELKKRHDLRTREWERGEGALTELSALIGLDEIPHRVECYDNSHIMGTDTVGSMIVFTDGKPDKSEYRRFRIKAQADGDDYLAMDEMLTRRFERAKNADEKFMHLPDLIIADGGRGQLNVVLSVLERYGMQQIPAIGLAEKNEEIVLPGYSENLVLDKHSAPLHLIQRIRDEAHRFAITYHRSLRSKSALYSVLDTIDGIGEKRKRALFDKFISIDAIKAAGVDELAATDTMNTAAAKKVYDFFHTDGQKSDT